MWKPKILFWPTCWLSNHIEMNRHHVGSRAGVGGLARTGKTASVFCSALFTLSASLLPAESLLSVPQPAKGRDPGDGEGPVRPPRRQHFKCESCSDAPYGLSTARPLKFTSHRPPRLPQIGPARFRAPELLFRPDLIGDESSGIHEVLAYAIQKSDMDLRRTLFSTIVLCGGSTLIKGLERIGREPDVLDSQNPTITR